MRAIFLGTADGHTSARREHSGILIQTRETSLLLDCGAAAARFLSAKKSSRMCPEILWISHMHSDHNGQVSSLIQSLWLRTRRAPLHVFGPAEVLTAHEGLAGKMPPLPGADRLPDPLASGQAGPALDPRPVHPHRLCHRSISISLASHFKRAYPKTCFDCYGLLIEYEGKRYVYSADLAHPVELAPALKGGKVTALLCELTHFPERDLFHEVAKYPVQSVWITHYPDHLVRREAEIKLIAREEKFRGEVHLMHDRVAHEI